MESSVFLSDLLTAHERFGTFCSFPTACEYGSWEASTSNKWIHIGTMNRQERGQLVRAFQERHGGFARTSCPRSFRYGSWKG